MSDLRQNLLKSVGNRRAEAGQHETGSKDRKPRGQTSDQLTRARQHAAPLPEAQARGRSMPPLRVEEAHRKPPAFEPNPSFWERDSSVAESPNVASFSEAHRASIAFNSEVINRQQSKVSFMSEHSTIPSPGYLRSQASSQATLSPQERDQRMRNDTGLEEGRLRQDTEYLSETQDAPPYKKHQETALEALTSRPVPTPLQPKRVPAMEATGNTGPSSRHLRQELYNALVVKQKRIKLARRRIRLFEGLALVSAALPERLASVLRGHHNSHFGPSWACWLLSLPLPFLLQSGTGKKMAKHHCICFWWSWCP